MDPKETYLRNCVIAARQPATTPLFSADPKHGMQCCLDGYAVLPVEEYEALQAVARQRDALLDLHRATAHTRDVLLDLVFSLVRKPR
jgi:hypothetical protein